jgi:PAS domain S-box-containing protein
MASPLHVLFIDICESDAGLILHHLTKDGNLVTSERVGTAESMRSALDKQAWDVIISDCSLASFSAPSALAILQERGQDIPFIIVSGTITDETGSDLMRSGASDYLMKDRLARLAPLVKRELNNVQLHREHNETRAELQKAQKSQEWSKLIYNTTTGAMFLLAVEPDSVYRFLSVNAAFLKSSDLSESQVVGKRADEVLSHHSAQYVLGKYEEAILLGRAIHYEEIADLSRGTVTFKTTLVPILDQNGNCIHLLGSSYEVTDPKGSADALARSEQHTRSLFDLSSIAIWKLDLSDVKVYFNQLKSSGVTHFREHFEGHADEITLCARKIKILDINRRSMALLKADCKEDIYNKLSGCIMDETIQGFTNILIALAEGKNSIEFEIPVRTFTNEELFLNCSIQVTPGCEDTLSAVLAFFKDITLRSRAEKALKESRDQLEWLFDVLPVGISVLDQDRQLVKSNPALEEILAISKEGLLRGDYRRRRYFRPDGTLMPSEEFASSRVENGEKSVYHVETGVEKEDGSMVWTDISAAACGFPDWHTVIAISDITGRVEMENKNHHLLEQLRQQNFEQEMIIKLTSHLRQAQKADEAQMILVEQALEIFSVDAVALFLISDGSFHVSACSGNGNPWSEASIPQGEETFKEILSSGHPCFMNSAEEIENIFPLHLPDANPMEILVSVALVQVHSGDAPIGLLALGNYSNKSHFETQINLLTTVAEIAGITIQRMKTMESTGQLVSRRTNELTALYNVISVASKSKVLKDRLDTALGEVLRSLSSSHGGIFLFDKDKNRLISVADQKLPPELKVVIENSPMETTWEGWVMLHDEALIIPDILADPRFLDPNNHINDQTRVYIGVPIRNQERIMGVLSIIRTGREIFSLDEITFVSALANHIGVSIENNNLIEQVEKAALLEERSRLARELHDSVTQTLYSATFFAEAGQKMVKQGNLKQTQEYLVRLSQISQQALKEMRLLIYQLRPEVLKEEGLVSALRQRLELVENKVAIQTNLTVNQIRRLSDQVEDTLYWTAIEALNNITKHAQASQIWVQINVEEDRVILTIEDDGKGFDLNETHHQSGMGLNNIRERLQKEGGCLEITSSKGKGTMLTAICPLDK